MQESAPRCFNQAWWGCRWSDAEGQLLGLRMEGWWTWASTLLLAGVVLKFMVGEVWGAFPAEAPLLFFAYAARFKASVRWYFYRPWCPCYGSPAPVLAWPTMEDDGGSSRKWMWRAQKIFGTSL